MRLKIRCPNAECRKVLVVDDKYAGQKGKCSTCGSKFVIPAPNRPSKRTKPTAPAATEKPGGEKVKAGQPTARGKTPTKPKESGSAPGRSSGTSGARKQTPPSAKGAGRSARTPQRPQPGRPGKPKRPAADEDVSSADELSDFLVDDGTEGGTEGGQVAAEDFEDYEDYEAADSEDYEVDDFDDFAPAAPRGKRKAKAARARDEFDDFDDFEDDDAGDDFSDAEDYDDYDEPPRSRRSGGRSRGKGGSLAKAGSGVLLLQISAYIYLVTVGMVFLSALVRLMVNVLPLFSAFFMLIGGLIALLSMLCYLASFLTWFCSAVGYGLALQAPDRCGTRGLSIGCLVAVCVRIVLFFTLVAVMIGTVSELLDRGSRSLAPLMQAGFTALLVGFLMYVTIAVEIILGPILLGSLNEQANRGRTVADARTARNLGIAVVAAGPLAALIGYMMGVVGIPPILIALLGFVLMIAASAIGFIYLIRLIALTKATRDNIT